MKKRIFFYGFIVCFFIGLIFHMNPLIAQIGIGTTNPNASAKLDLNASNKGFLPPRIALTGAGDNTTIPSPATGLLVYCTGAAGLAAGYYYWNGASWATIATATGAGNVTAANLVKLYGEVFSNAVGKINHSNGYAFTVSVTGRYLFEFVSSVGFPNASRTIVFSIRNASNTVLASDQQTTWNNNRSEVTGRMEVDLTAGTTYNAYISGVESRDNNDWDRLYYKQVAGNLSLSTPYAISIGGTGATTATGALNNLLPSQSGNAGKLLKTDGTNASWGLADPEDLSSTSEIATNKTYFGRTVYRKRFKGNFNAGAETLQYFSLPDLYLVVKVSGTVQRNSWNWNNTTGGDTRVYTIGNGAEPNFAAEVWTDRQNARMTIFNIHAFYLGQPYHLVIEYVKTTGPSIPASVFDN